MDKCIFCHDTGLCDWCKGTGKSFGGTGSSACAKCGGTGKCNKCHGSSARSSAPKQQSFGQSSFGQPKSFGQSSFGPSNGFGQPSSGFGSHQASGFGAEVREDPFEKAKRIVEEGINLLQSTNPASRLRGMEMINSHDAFHSRKMAYSVVLQLFPNEIDDQVKSKMIGLILAFGKGDPKAFEHFRYAANDTNPEIAFQGSLGLISYPQGVEEGLQRLRFAYDNGPSSLQRAIIGQIGKLGQKAEPVVDLVTKKLSSTSWLMRRTTKKAVKNLKKAGVNVVGYLVKQLETGSDDEKVAACAGLGALEKDAKGSVDALVKALKDPNSSVRAKSAWALMQMDKNASPAEAALQEALKDESPAVSHYALKALKNFSKISKEQKEQIKEIEEHEKEIKQIQKTWGLKEKEIPKESEEEEDTMSAEPEYKNKFFMSHSSKDFIWVQKVARIIESWPGCKAWICERDIYHGQDWLEAIYDGIEDCNWYILFWSQNAENSKWTQEEIKEAKLRNVQSGDINPKISIVNLGMTELPRLLTRHQGTKVTSDADIEEFCNRLKTQVQL